MGRPH